MWGRRLELELPRQGRFTLQVGGQIGACTGAGVCAGVSRCAASGLYRRGDNKLIRVMRKLSGEIFFFSPSFSQREPLIPLLLLLTVPGKKTGETPSAVSGGRALNVEGDDNALR